MVPTLPAARPTPTQLRMNFPPPNTPYASFGPNEVNAELKTSTGESPPHPGSSEFQAAGGSQVPSLHLETGWGERRGDPAESHRLQQTLSWDPPDPIRRNNTRLTAAPIRLEKAPSPAENGAFSIGTFCTLVVFTVRFIVRLPPVLDGGRRMAMTSAEFKVGPKRL